MARDFQPEQGKRVKAKPEKITALCHKITGEVLKISSKGQMFPIRDKEIFEVIESPNLRHGMEVNPPDIDVTRPFNNRVLGFAKRYSGKEIRNASESEITSWYEQDDKDARKQDKKAAQARLEANPVNRKVNKAFVKLILNEINDLRAAVDLPARDARDLLAQVNSLLSEDD